MDNIVKAVKVLKFKDVTVIGSGSDISLKYFSDLDLQEKLITNDSPRKLVLWFQKKIAELDDLNDVFFIEFKGGFQNGQPIKWDFDEVEQGYKNIDGRKLFLDIIFVQKSIIKIDFIVYQSGSFIEVSLNYYFQFHNGNLTYDDSITTDEIGNRLIYEYQQLKNENFYKALKRLYSYYKLVEDKKALIDLRKVFNSKFGYLNKQLSDLKTIKILLDFGYNDKKTRHRVIKALSQIEFNILNYPKYKTDFIKFRTLTLDNINDKLVPIIDKLSFMLQEDIHNFINKSKFNYFLK
jgi:hypothetical protein